MKRSEGYIGVLIDDLINKGTDEPYRMFTSRAEYRILLRQDNADLRLTKKGHELGLAKEERLKNINQKEADVNVIRQILKTEKVTPDLVNDFLLSKGSAAVKEKCSLETLLKRPDITLPELSQISSELENTLKKYNQEALEQSEIQIKYQSYIEKEEQLAAKIHLLENYQLNEKLNYDTIVSLSSEGKEKLKKIKPFTLGQASRISGVSPADISILMVYLGR